MIKINLALKRKIDPNIGIKSQGLFGIQFGDIKIGEIKQLPIAKVAVPIIIFLICNNYFEKYEEDELLKLRTLESKYSDEGRKLQKGLEKIKSYEALKKELDADEVAMRNKLDTIQSLISTRANTEKMVITVANSTPSGIWLKEFKYSDAVLTVKGGANEYNQISDFMKNLSESAMFTNVELKNSERSKDRHDGGQYEIFELRAQRKQ